MRQGETFDRLVHRVCFISNILFVLIHILYLFLALLAGIYTFVFMNMASAVIYIVFFIIIHKKKYEIFTLFCGIEIAAFMTASTMLAGYNAGFQLCLIGLCTLAFVTKYFLKEKRLIINPVYVSLFFAADYIFLYFYCKYTEPVLVLPDYLNMVFYLGHSIVVFIFCVGFLEILLRYVFRLEVIVTKESETDKLTQIPNRKALTSYFERLDNQKSNYVLAIFDIDGFKLFNDINGHLCGDYILKEVANIAKNNSLNDFVSRWGGEEFVIIAKIENNLEDTYHKIDMIRKKVEEYSFVYDNKELHSTITIGIASYEENDDLDSWIEKADKMLYKGKELGKNLTIY